MRSASLCLACLFFPLLSAIGCTEEFVASGGSGGGGTTTTTGGGGAASTTTTSTSSSTCAAVNGTECDACLVQACTTPYCECAGNPACQDYYSCLGDAQGQPDAIAKCGVDHPNAIAEAGRVWSCGASSCAACKLPPITECLSCQFDKCPDEINACLGSKACVTYVKCLEGCAKDDQACKTNCYNDSPSGANPLNDLLLCASGKCATPCAPPT